MTHHPPEEALKMDIRLFTKRKDWWLSAGESRRTDPPKAFNTASIKLTGPSALV
jgi:hypothetical protein